MHEFRILEALTKNPDMSQKSLSVECGISIGKVNYTINKLNEAQFIDTLKLGKKHRYLVTDKGRGYLKQELQHLQDSKININSVEPASVKQAVILAAGTKNDFQQPVCTLPLEETTLLERTLSILKKNEIEKIVIVTGYKQEQFDGLNFLNDENIFLVYNENYKRSGSMASLARAKDHIDGDFILIEDDILIEEGAISELIDQPVTDSMLVTNESGSGDEAFIEIRNGYLYNMSKDIHQLNRVDGEMIGVTKLSYRVYQEMLAHFKTFNKNPYVNYEYVLMDVSRSIKISYLKIPDLIWAEVDNKQQYNKILEKVYPMLQRKELSFVDEVKDAVSEALRIPVESITAVVPFGGMTNRNYKVTIEGEDYVVRVSGFGTEKMINRLEEKLNSEMASDLGINPEQLFFSVETGLKIAKYIPQAETLNPKIAKKEANLSKVAGLFSILHQSGKKMENSFDGFEKMEEYEALVKQGHGAFYDGYEQVKAEVLQLKSFYEGMGIELTPCHNDPVPENFVKSGEDKMFLIDWEYGGMNDPYWDIAAFSLECDLSEDEEEMFLTAYRKKPATIEDRQKLLLNKIFQDFLWSTWTVLKEAAGDDFGPYGINRYTRAQKNMKVFQELYRPEEELVT
ncbi:winged helix-turn-helix transcriptional regulator [Bacillus tianshenii]|uniref:phosphocholine cytidylyltransferase/choline kinase family protein n=1 Tax=Sutcliffiella tianshenii TaxID=1463404 RepID=UPI001CD483A8|nr:phosphocholine cytidylyltransferase/choline kinase family protein [Bacillus tianshenii]MCA1320485.1 winged helix-turn-helix transcriptional regulator [Bacillus tianshenii]